ncbi:hypothetical protein [Cerasicoccus maritimus]|uniref:hypothetical protein n=1 Tax=Cerasicoccus maritimus TaxID=490089 RepID=UPI002852B852|nr:hypothetical protein [Cerasicoccus maritimus]
MKKIKEFMAGIEPWTVDYGTLDDFPRYHVYFFEWIDRLTSFEDAEEALDGWSLKGAFLNHFMHRFQKAGWNGSGNKQILWLPPFSGVGAPSKGFYVFHIKQKEDGISWLACRYPILGLEENEILNS